MADKPIFYDPSGRRGRRMTVGVWVFVVALVLLIAAFFATLLFLPPEPPIVLGAPATLTQSLERSAHKAKRKLTRLVHNRHAASLSDWDVKAHAARAAGVPVKPLTVAFYAPWDETSLGSLRRHVSDVDWIVPHWLSVTGPDHHVTVFPDKAGRSTLSHAKNAPAVLPMIQNAIGGNWDGKGFAALMASPKARADLIDKLIAFVDSRDAEGIMFDFEDFPPSGQANYLRFLREARAAFGKRGWIVTLSVPFDDPDWNLRAYSKAADRVFLMAYDEHWKGGTPGPVASQPWFARTLQQNLKHLDPKKTILCFGNYGYDWVDGTAEAMTVEEAYISAHDSGAVIQFDAASGNPTFSFTFEGHTHEAWFLDAVTAHNQIKTARDAGITQLALWRLGTEDPSVWSVFGKRASPSPQALRSIPPGSVVDVEGSGEVLQITATPTVGRRDIIIGPNGFITNESIPALPTPWVVHRVGYKPGLVALTFDDGPDDRWTGAILDILKAKHAPATFFVVGENALGNIGLLRRIVREGHELGNHTYTHPNLDLLPDTAVELELAGTQRLVEAFTGRSLRLFRAPFFGDAEPTTADELEPILKSQKLGYISVGLHVDTDDWQGPPASVIAKRAIDGVEAGDAVRSGNIILLHDSGGTRTETIKALPAIIDGLRARGYRFVGVSELAGLSRDSVMPHIAGPDSLVPRADMAMFIAVGGALDGLKILFVVAITLGIARASFLTIAAIMQARREKGIVAPPVDPARFVTVMIPAFNEEKVIESAVRRVLESTGVQIEVIVIDDGSKDRTSEIVRNAFGNHPKVRLLTLPNGGKAHALNRGLALAGGDVVVALDADTQFEPETIARLARWFANPKLGAVAGNARVGNRVNIVTRWQALEYVTAQNLERRALGLLDAITVVPGAVGAWRAEALRQLGGFPPDTLAEDQDLTIAVQRAGWKVIYDQDAVAWTEAPESFRALARQRYRWAFGTLQCLWKHRAILFRREPGGLGRFGLPQAWLFQIAFSVVSPLIDLALFISIFSTLLGLAEHGWAASAPDLYRMLTYWVAFTLFDFAAAATAFRLERNEDASLLRLLIPQRFGYRQIMYYVVLKALVSALRGPSVGWGKQERSGRVAAAPNG